MARINIEDSLFKDRRWTNFLIRVGCQHKALGILCGAWILSQTHWLKSKSVPKKAWPKDYDVLIECELAERRDDGSVYVKGSSKAFAWLEQKVEAGRKGGLVGRKGNKKNTISESIQRNGARFLLNKAVKSGEIIKPTHCSQCGVDGTIEGHHSDYSKPFEVDWVCKKCHTLIHRQLREAGAKRVLNDDKREEAYVNPPTPTPTLSPSLTPVQPQTPKKEENHSGSLADNVEKSTSSPTKKSKKVQVFTSVKEVIEAIPKATKEIWKELYSDPEYLQREALRAWHYYAIQNPKKLPKSLGGWSRVLSYWFDKNWVKHVKGVPTRRMTNSETNQQSLQDLYDKVQREGS